MGKRSIAIQWVEGGRLRCRSYEGIAVDRPVFIVITHPRSTVAEQNALALAGELHGEVLALPDAVLSEDATHPLSQVTECGVFGGGQAQRLLVMVGDDVTPLVPGPFAHWSPQYVDVASLAVLPQSAKRQAAALLQAPLNEDNAVFWSSTIGEAVPAIFACSAATLEVPRVFISYRQKESAALAMQLFDALSHRGFDVFLDHYRIPPGVNFQKRLTQELGDKSMVVVLESEGILESEWTTYEVSTAKSCELSLFALNLPQGVEVPVIPDAARMPLDDSDFAGGSFTALAELTEPRLTEAVTRIRAAHDAGVIARRGATREQLQRKLLLRGVTDHQVDPASGALRVRVHAGSAGQAKEYLIWASVRSPELGDFHGAHTHVVEPAGGVVVALSRLLEERTAKRIQWLSGMCKIKLFDRGQIDDLTQQIADGSL